MGGLYLPNVTAHPQTGSVPRTVLLYNGPLLGGFNVPVYGLTSLSRHGTFQSESIRSRFFSSPLAA